MNPEHPRGEFAQRGQIVHLLPDQMRRIVIESKVRARDLLEHAPPDRGTDREVLSPRPFVGAVEHRAVLDGNTNSLVLCVSDQIAPDRAEARPVFLNGSRPVTPNKRADDREVEHFRGAEDALEVQGHGSSLLLIRRKKIRIIPQTADVHAVSLGETQYPRNFRLVDGVHVDVGNACVATFSLSARPTHQLHACVPRRFAESEYFVKCEVRDYGAYKAELHDF